VDEIRKYKQMYEEDIADLSRQVATRETWLQQLRDDNQQLKETIKARVQERYDEHLRDADETIEEYREEITSLREKLGRHTQLFDDLIQHLHADLEQVKKEKQYWIDLYDEGDGNLKREVESLRSELEQVKKERDAWKKSSKDQFSELFMLRHELSQFESK
jgi:chromosome segregation ATPase